MLTESTRIVRDLIPDSAAAKAGVRNGDEITRPVGQDQLQGEQDGVLTLAVAARWQAVDGLVQAARGDRGDVVVATQAGDREARSLTVTAHAQ